MKGPEATTIECPVCDEPITVPIIYRRADVKYDATGIREHAAEMKAAEQ